MIDIFRKNNILILKYLPYNPINWIFKKFTNNEEIILAKVFHLSKKHIYDNQLIEEDDSEILFIIGKLIDGYWNVDKDVLEVNFNIYIHEECKITKQTFQSKTGLSIFKELFKVVQQDIWIGGNHINAIDLGTFLALVNRFPTNVELDYYVLARVTSILREHFLSTIDFEKKYEKYVLRKRKNYEDVIGFAYEDKTLKKLFKENELNKYKEIHNELNKMTQNPENYDEKKWQEKIIDILLLLYPKYICVFSNVQIKDPYLLKNRYLDYLFLDTNGNTDIVEIKKPFNDCILRKTKYRDNYVPMIELSGAIMQIEKYIYYMNKWGIEGEKKLTNKYKKNIPKGIEVHITNPKGIVIMGKSNEFSEEQIIDFEIIKRKYLNVIDILTYDDLIRRVERIISYFK